MRIPFRWCLPLLAAAGCPTKDCNDTGDTSLVDTAGGGGGGDSDEPDPPPYRAQVVPTGCDAHDPTPVARRYPQVALMDRAADPLVVGNRSVQRGILVFGGKDDHDRPLGDMWVFDLGANGDCAWVKLSDSVPYTYVVGQKQVQEYLEPGHGVWGATFHVIERPTTTEVLLAGGFHSTARGEYTATSWFLLDLARPARGFVQRGPLPALDFLFVRKGDPTCLDDQFTQNTAYCSRGNRCTTTTFNVTHDSPCAGDGGLAIGTPGGSCASGWDYGYPGDLGYKPGCGDDPWCTDPSDGMELVDVRANGVGLASSVYDPTTGHVQIHGGVVGCHGPATVCDARIQALADADGLHRDLNHNVVDLLWLAGSPYVIDINLGSGQANRIDADPFGWHEGFGCAGALDSTYGVNHGGAALLGQDYSPTSGQFAGNGTTWVAGGTRYQQVQPGANHVTGEMTVSNGSACPSTTYDGFDGEDEPFNATDCDNRDASDGLRRNLRVASWNGGARNYDGRDFTPSDRYAVAVAPIASDRMLIAGGKREGDAVGVSEFDVVDPVTGEMFGVDTSVVPPRYGSGAVYDPLTRSSYVFGGLADPRMYEVVGPDTIEANASSRFELSDVVVSLDIAATTGTLAQTATVTHHCDGEGCFADRFQVRFPGRLSSADLVEVMTSKLLIDGEPAASYGPLLFNGDPFGATVFLRRPLVDGSTVTMDLAPWTREQESHLLSLGAVAAQFTGLNGFRSGDAYGWFFQGRPFDVSRDFENDPSVPVGVDRVEVVALAGESLIGAGTPDTFGDEQDDRGRSIATWRNLPPMAADSFGVVALPTLEPAAQVTTPGGARLQVWMDTTLTDVVRTDWMGRLGTGGALEQDAAFLESHLGSYPVAVAPVVLLSGLDDGTGIGGMSLPGMHFVHSFSPSGGFPTDSTGVVRIDLASTTHELAHAWFGGLRVFPNPIKDSATLVLVREGTAWVGEGMPRLLEMMRYPDPSADRFSSAVSFLTLSPGSADLQQHVEDNSLVRYDVSAYSLAQFHYVASYDLGSEQAVWEDWRELLHSKPFGSVLDSSEVEALVRRDTVAFFDDWIKAGRVGTPLLSMSYTPEPIAAPSEELVLRVRQVQVDEYGVNHIFGQVPFGIGCHQLTDEAIAPFDCTYNRQERNAGNGWVLDLEAQDYVLRPLAQPVSPAFIALVANDRLLPEVAPRYSIATSTWRLVCGTEDFGPECVDMDGDGYPAAGDCDDGNSAIYPGAPDTRRDGVDSNCDGWGAAW